MLQRSQSILSEFAPEYKICCENWYVNFPFVGMELKHLLRHIQLELFRFFLLFFFFPHELFS